MVREPASTVPRNPANGLALVCSGIYTRLSTTGRWLVILLVAAFLHWSGSVQAHAFSSTDYVLILIEGPAIQSTPWNLSGTASMYVAPGRHQSDNRPLIFTEVANGVPVERRSARKVDQPSDYGPSGQVPPGVYSLFYARFDNKSYPPHIPNGFHRLGLGDRPCDISTRTCDATLRAATDKGDVIRDHIQFHLAWNDDAIYSKDISKGCITLSTANWRRLFPEEFTQSKSSPLLSGSDHSYKGYGRVMVFVTNLLDPKDQARQIALFKTLMTLGLNDTHFQNSDARKLLVRQWTWGVQ